MAETFTVTAPVWLWSEGKGSWHFLSVTGAQSDAIRFETMGMRGGFGSVRVKASINGIEWTTSLFPSGEKYLLPIKADIRRRAKIAAGDEVKVELKLA